MSAVLELVDVHAGYGPFRALFGVDISVEPGEAVAVVGPNGVGKTTVARVASGLITATSGTVRVDGQDLTRGRTYQFARAGVAHAPEGRSTFATLTVAENLELSIRSFRGSAGVRDGLDEAFELFPALAERKDQMAGTLSGGQQRMLAMARVLVDKPKVLVADELSLGLAPMIVQQVYETLARIREAGTALLVIEQHVAHALALCDRVVLLDKGTVAWTGPSDEAGAVVQAQLGLAVPTEPVARTKPAAKSKPAGSTKSSTSSTSSESSGSAESAETAGSSGSKPGDEGQVDSIDTPAVPGAP